MSGLGGGADGGGVAERGGGESLGDAGGAGGGAGGVAGGKAGGLDGRGGERVDVGIPDGVPGVDAVVPRFPPVQWRVRVRRVPGRGGGAGHRGVGGRGSGERAVGAGAGVEGYCAVAERGEGEASAGTGGGGGVQSGGSDVDRGVREFLERGGEKRRVDLAIDNIGGGLLPEVIETLGMNGRVSVVGRLAGPVPEFNTSTLLFRRIRMGGVAVGTYTRAESRAAWASVVGLLGTTGAKPVVDGVFAFADAMKAFARLAAGPMGKVLVRVG